LGEGEPGAGLIGAAVEDVVILGTATPVEVAAVIGSSAMLTDNQATPVSTGGQESFNWTSYAGFLGLLLFLAALALIVYRRRIDGGRTEL
jgi:protein-S-isoprenylcysteine O-methyltransferase Ste14